MLLEKVRSERTLSTFNCYLNVFRIAIGINTGCKVVLSTKYNKLIYLIAFAPRCSKPSNNFKVGSNKQLPTTYFEMVRRHFSRPLKSAKSDKHTQNKDNKRCNQEHNAGIRFLARTRCVLLQQNNSAVNIQSAAEAEKVQGKCGRVELHGWPQFTPTFCCATVMNTGD